MKNFVKEIYNLLIKIDANIEKLVKNTSKSSGYYSETPYKVKFPPVKPEQKPVTSYNNYNQRHVTYDEWHALDEVYMCLVDKGSHPDHHDYIMRELENKWPILFNNLKKLVEAKEAAINKNLSTKYYN